MALALVLIGVVLMVSAVRGTYGQLGQLLSGDFTGQGNFFYWVAAVGILGALGYTPYFQRPMRALLALVIIAFCLENGTGFFANLQSALSGATPQAAPQTDTVASEAPTTALPINLLGGSSGSPLGSLGGIANAASSILGGL